MYDVSELQHTFRDFGASFLPSVLSPSAHVGCALTARPLSQELADIGAAWAAAAEAALEAAAAGALRRQLCVEVHVWRLELEDRRRVARVWFLALCPDGVGIALRT